MVISLGRRSLSASSDLPGDGAGHAIVPLRDLAAARACPFHPAYAGSSLWRGPHLTVDGCYPLACPALSGLSSTAFTAATVWPARMLSLARAPRPRGDPTRSRHRIPPRRSLGPQRPRLAGPAVRAPVRDARRPTLQGRARPCAIRRARRRAPPATRSRTPGRHGVRLVAPTRAARVARGPHARRGP